MFLDFTRRRACAFCGRRPPSEAHHYPPRGRLGLVDDSRVTPACRKCHERCHGACPPGLVPIDGATQARAVEENQLSFFRQATPDEWNAFGRDRAARFECPMVEL
jgi:hypothetical protein